MAERVGMVGVGLMGHAFASNLIAAGFEVQGFDPVEERMTALAALGGTPVGSPAAAARGVQWVITSLPNSGIVREVALGTGGIVEGAEAGLVVIDTSTSSPQESMGTGEALAARGVGFLDASVSGTSEMAAAKDLIVVAGGSAEDFEGSRAVLAGFSREAYYLGPNGNGALAKLIINLNILAHRYALAEGLVLAEKAGIDLGRMLAILKDSAAGCKVMDQKGTKMVEAEYSPVGRLLNATKDIGLIVDQGRVHESPMLLSSAIAEGFWMAGRQGYSELDGASIFEFLREMAGLPGRAAVERG